MFNSKKENSKVEFDSFCIKEQKLYLRTFHQLLDRITRIFLLDYVSTDDENCPEYYDKLFQGWQKFLYANTPTDLIEIKGKELFYEMLQKMILSHKSKDPLMPKWLLEEYLNDKNKIYLTIYNFQEITDLKKISDEMRNFRKGKLNPADLIYNCLYYDLFESVDSGIECEKDSGLDKKRFIQKRKFELKERAYYSKIIDFLFTNAYLLLDPDYSRRRKRGVKKKYDSLPTYPTIYELLPKKSKSYNKLISNFKKFFKQNHCLSGVLILKKQTPNGSSKFLDLKVFSVPYIPLQGFRYQEVSDAKDDSKILRISERDSISHFLSLTGLKNSLGFCDEVFKIDFSYCLTIARHRLNSLIGRIDNVFNFNEDMSLH